MVLWFIYDREGKEVGVYYPSQPENFYAPSSYGIWNLPAKEARRLKGYIEKNRKIFDDYEKAENFEWEGYKFVLERIEWDPSEILE